MHIPARTPLPQLEAYRRKEITPPPTPQLSLAERFPQPEDGFAESDNSDWDEAEGEGLFDVFDES